MKNNRGKILLILLLFFSYVNMLDAKEEEYNWSAFINKKSAYVNEAIYLKYECEFEGRGELYVIEFTPKSTSKYEIISLSQNQKIQNNKRIQTYEYVVFAKVDGLVEFDFDISMKKTNEDSITNAILGRDNLEFEEYKIKILKQKKLAINVKKAPTKLVGSFELEVKKDETNIKAYEPYHLSIIIKGTGNLDAIKAFKFSNDAKVFASEAEKKYKLTKDGYKGTLSQKFAFVGSKDFNISDVQIEYFDRDDAKKKTLRLKETIVKVSSAYEVEELLDEVDEHSFIFKNEYLYYLLTFITGFLLAKVNFKRSDNNPKNNYDFKQKVKNTKTLEELHILLILQDGVEFKNIIVDIQSGKLQSLGQVKKLLAN